MSAGLCVHEWDGSEIVGGVDWKEPIEGIEFRRSLVSHHPPKFVAGGGSDWFAGYDFDFFATFPPFGSRSIAGSQTAGLSRKESR
jgi:hypothetical protein